MTTFVAGIIDKLRNAGFNINPLGTTNLWHVDGPGNTSTGQLIDLVTKLQMSTR